MVWDLTATKRLWETRGGDLKLKMTVKNLFDKLYDTSDGDYMPGAAYQLALIWEL
jgi:outer membrane cobalamin receptor